MSQTINLQDEGDFIKCEEPHCDKTAVYMGPILDDEDEDQGTEALCELHCPITHSSSIHYSPLRPSSKNDPFEFLAKAKKSETFVQDSSTN